MEKEISTLLNYVKNLFDTLFNLKGNKLDEVFVKTFCILVNSGFNKIVNKVDNLKEITQYIETLDFTEECFKNNNLLIEIDYRLSLNNLTPIFSIYSYDEKIKVIYTVYFLLYDDAFSKLKNIKELYYHNKLIELDNYIRNFNLNDNFRDYKRDLILEMVKDIELEVKKRSN